MARFISVGEPATPANEEDPAQTVARVLWLGSKSKSTVTLSKKAPLETCCGDGTPQWKIHSPAFESGGATKASGMKSTGVFSS